MRRAAGACAARRRPKWLWTSPLRKCVSFRRRCSLKSSEWPPREKVNALMRLDQRGADTLGRRTGGKDSIDARQAQSALRPLRSNQAARRLEEAGQIEWPLL